MRRVLPVTVCLVLVGCVSLKSQRLDEVVRPARTPESVAVLADEPDRPFTVIAVVESSFEGALKGFDDLRREMIAEAARLGGDAVILGPEAKKTGHLCPDPDLLRPEEAHGPGDRVRLTADCQLALAVRAASSGAR